MNETRNNKIIDDAKQVRYKIIDGKLEIQQRGASIETHKIDTETIQSNNKNKLERSSVHPPSSVKVIKS
jgi:hypothetical protein